MTPKFFLPLTLGIALMAGCTGVGVSYRARTAPPPLRVETYGPAPGPGFVWINGYWNWGGNNYVWVPGRWDRGPRPGSRWVDPRWEHRGNSYRFHRGYWR